MTAKENILVPLSLDGRAADNDYLNEIAEVMGITERLNHYPHQLSGGQQQRVAIARAMITKPSVILADEPTGNLDSHSGKDVMKIIHQLHEEGRTIILITHDNDIAAEAQRVIRIQDGKIVDDYFNK